MGREIANEIIGPMPVDLFLNEFLPRKANVNLPSNIANNVAFFDTVPTTAPKSMTDAWGTVRGTPWQGVDLGRPVRESDMYDPLVTCLARLLTNFTIVNTSSYYDHQSKQDKEWKPDLLLYRNRHIPVAELKSNRRTRFDKAISSAELKTIQFGKVFVDPPEGVQNLGAKHSFLSQSDEAVAARGQLAAMLTEIFNRQHRTHCFMIFINDPDVRLIRCDRAGIIVSSAINFRTKPKAFLEYITRFDHLTRAEQGFDPTVNQASKEQTTLAHNLLSPWDPTPRIRQVVAMEVPDPETPRTPRKVLAWASLRDAKALTGRCTRAYPVVDITTGTVMFLKDTWRSCAPGIEKESDLIRELNTAGVQHVPRVIAGDDIPEQETKTQEYAGMPWVCRGDPELPDKRVHHRLLEDFIPTVLDDYESPKAMLTAIYHALIAHKGAFELGILHRDISNNNVLIQANGDGVLTDWELAIRVRDQNGQPIIHSKRQRYRTGTWAFISIALLQNGSKVHELIDDLESFFWLVLYLALVTLQCNLDPQPLIASIFDHSIYVVRTNSYQGGDGKRSMMADDHATEGLSFTGNEALTTWYQQLRRGFQDYRFKKSRPTLATTIPDQFEDHGFVLKVFEDAIRSEAWSSSEDSRVEPSGATRKASKKVPLHPSHRNYDGAEYVSTPSRTSQGSTGEGRSSRGRQTRSTGAPSPLSQTD